MTEKQLQERWAGFAKMVLEGTLTREEETAGMRDERVARLEADPEEWFRYYFPRFAYAPAARFQRDATRRVLTNQEWCEVRMWSRELAKSTRTMMEVFYMVFAGRRLADAAPSDSSGFHHKRCVLLASNSLDNASRLLMPYKANIAYNQRLMQDYGLKPGDSSWNAAEFITACGISFRAVGAGQSPRGTRNEEARPDIIVFDDLDTDADCLNPEIIARKWRWVEEAAIGTRSVSVPTSIIFCGNRIATDCCIQRATTIADEVSIVNIRDERGLSSWPEKNSELDIDRVLSQKSYAAQQKEYFNNPVVEGSVFKAMTYRPVRPLQEYKALVCYTDPSYKATADYKATVLVGAWQNEFHIIKCFLEQTTTATMIDWHYRILHMVGRHRCLFFMELVFMQDVLVKEVNDAARREGRHLSLRGDTRKKPDKYMRIESLLEPMVRNGTLFINEAERYNPHMQRLVEQFGAFAPGSSAHDDGPDAVEGAVWIITNKLVKTTASGIILGQRPKNNLRY